MEKLISQLEEIKLHVEKGTVCNNHVSKVDTYWHLDHTLRVLNGIPQALKNSNPKEYKPHFTFMKFIIMTFNKIPRGKGRAPKNVIPEDNITQLELLEQIETCKVALDNLNNLSANHHFKHPLFGHLNLKESQKFLWIHTEHHLKIVRDILKK